MSKKDVEVEDVVKVILDVSEKTGKDPDEVFEAFVLGVKMFLDEKRNNKNVGFIA